MMAEEPVQSGFVTGREVVGEVVHFSGGERLEVLRDAHIVFQLA